MPESARLEAESWLKRALDDLGATRKLLSGTDPFPATAAYHCQQAAEKALKAIVAATGEPIPKTHDLRSLVARCILVDGSLAKHQDACDDLTPYATEFRYPTEVPDPDPGEVHRAAALAQGIIDAVARSLRDRFPG